jgi:photosystem II stability/assembly factor-like uncharacterized protein
VDFVRSSMSLALVLAALAVSPAQAGFKGPLNTPAIATHLAAQRPLNAVVAAGSRLIAAGQRGNIIYSDDNGNSWKQAAVPVSSDLTAVFFSSERSGWAVGHDGVVLHSDDAGETWQLQLDGNRAAALMKEYYGKKAQAGDAQAAALLPDIDKDFSAGADKPFLDVWFANDKEGFAVGAFNMIFRTDDGGNTWEPWFDRIDNPRRLHLYSIRGQGGRVYVAGEQGLVAYLDAGAQRFEAIHSPYAGSFFGVLPMGAGAVVYGMRGNAFRIDEKGTNWQKLDAGVVGGLTGATSLGDDRLALVSTAGDVLVGSAGTGRFERLKTPRDMLFAGVAFVGATQSLASVGSNGAVMVPMEQKQ